MKKIISVLLSLTLVFTLSSAAFAASELVITDPYEGMDWDSVNFYKTALHTHTNASDGDPTLRESLERHAETGFDAVATTDHGTVNYSWSEACPNALIHGALSLVGKSEGELDYLGSAGSFANGITYTLETAENGDDYLTMSDGRTMLRIPYGIENNAVSVNAHVNSWFVDYCDNSVTVYEDAVSSVDALGGVCVINHPGEYTKARYELHDEDAYNENNPVYKYYIDKYAAMLEKYDSCIGVDVNSKGDARTRFDRILWDRLLTRFAAKGENVFAIASSDAHQLNKIDTGFTLIAAESLTSENLRSSLESGHFLAASHCIGSPEELCEIAAALKEIYGETELYTKVQSVYEEMQQRVYDIENGNDDADSAIGTTYSVLDDEGYTTVDTFPSVTGISVDGSKITIDTEDALIIRWISNGELVATTPANGSAFDISDYADSIGDYVRAEIFGEGGIIYTQAFLINAEANAASSSGSDFFVSLGFLDFLFAEINNWIAILGRMLSNLVKC